MGGGELYTGAARAAPGAPRLSEWIQGANRPDAIQSSMSNRHSSDVLRTMLTSDTIASIDYRASIREVARVDRTLTDAGALG